MFVVRGGLSRLFESFLSLAAETTKYIDVFLVFANFIKYMDMFFLARTPPNYPNQIVKENIFVCMFYDPMGCK